MKTQYQKQLQQDFVEQTYFAEQLFQVTERYIPTSYGQIYSITAGMPGQPLILIVHGSGPKNSSAQYIHLLQQYLVRISYIEKFYLVAIDCPGYGKSVGSKQAVKTFPRQMFEEILKGLNYKQYFAMYGHSQGGAAIFNALHENNSLAEIMLMDRPVCGNIQRFRKFNIPTLLIYDIQDDGHPIWQGKLLYKELSYSELYTYRSSQDPYWVPDNIWQRMLQFFAKYSNNRKGKSNLYTGSRATSLQPERFRKTSLKKEKLKKEKLKKQQVKKRLQIKQSQVKQVKNKNKVQRKQSNSSNSSQVKFKSKKPHSLDSGFERFSKTQAKISFKQKQKNNLIEIQQQEFEKQELLSVYSSSLSEQEKDELKLMQEQIKMKQQEMLKDQKFLFIKSKQEKFYQIDQNVIIEKIALNKNQKQPKINNEQKKSMILTDQQAQLVKKKQLTQQQLQQNNRCAICYDTYYRPLQTNCNHIFCTKCLLQALLVDPRCPLCRGNITKKTQKKQLHKQLIQNMSKSQIQKRQKSYLKLKLMLDSIVLIEIGNRSIELDTKKSHFSKTKKKFMWELFVKQKTNFKFQQVGFDVNMGNRQSRPVKVRNAPFVFESRGTFSFSCQITIKPRNKQYAPLVTTYRINLQPGVHSKTIAFKKKVYMKQ